MDKVKVIKQWPWVKIILVFSVCGLLFVPGEVDARYRVTCKSVILSDMTRVSRLYGKQVDRRILPASTVKVLTALIVLERLPLDKEVTISSHVTYPPPSKIYLHPGERYSIKELLYATLINSANDASVALAEAVAGSEAEFVRLMNVRARQLGAKHSKFVNPHGLTFRRNPQYTTAYDMYLIFREALKYSFFRDTIKLKYKYIYSSAGRKILLRNHNRILFKDWDKKIYGKTGYTNAAQACFVGTVQKGKSTLIVAVFGCSHRWTDIKYVVSRYGGISL